VRPGHHAGSAVEERSRLPRLTESSWAVSLPFRRGKATITPIYPWPKQALNWANLRGEWSLRGSGDPLCASRRRWARRISRAVTVSVPPAARGRAAYQEVFGTHGRRRVRRIGTADRRNARTGRAPPEVGNRAGPGRGGVTAAEPGRAAPGNVGPARSAA
jgi:hypothetical protein